MLLLGPIRSVRDRSRGADVRRTCDTDCLDLQWHPLLSSYLVCGPFWTIFNETIHNWSPPRCR